MIKPFVRLGLRARVSLSFGALFLVLSAFLALLTFEVTRGYLVHQRESAALRQAASDARVMASGIKSANADIPTLLDALGNRAGSEVLVYVGSQVFASSTSASPSSLPASFTAAASKADGTVVKQRFARHDSPALAVGGRLSPGLIYIEVFPLSELEHSLSVFSTVLLAGAILLTVIGTALGFIVSSRVIKPVTSAAHAAARLAQGHLDTRLTGGHDRDLASLAASFNGMAESLQKRIQRDAAFAADVSHELRTPLTAIITAASVLESDAAQLTPRSKRAARLISCELVRFERLVGDLIEIARADAGAPLELERVSIAQLVRESVRRSAYPGVDLDITTDAMILGDKLRLERVIHNLLDNAAHHGGGAVRLGLHEVAKAVRIEVDDAGSGVPPEIREVIFERFHRGPGAASTSKGSGIGLALVEEHVRLHGGSVVIEESDAGGARFAVSLPKAPR